MGHPRGRADGRQTRCCRRRRCPEIRRRRPGSLHHRGTPQRNRAGSRFCNDRIYESTLIMIVDLIYMICWLIFIALGFACRQEPGHPAFAASVRSEWAPGRDAVLPLRWTGVGIGEPDKPPVAPELGRLQDLRSARRCRTVASSRCETFVCGEAASRPSAPRVNAPARRGSQPCRGCRRSGLDRTGCCGSRRRRSCRRCRGRPGRSPRNGRAG